MDKLKKLFVNHGEKIGMAVVALIVLVGLSGADWVPYDGTPGQITTKVREAESRWTPAEWPPEEAEQFALKPEDDPAAVVAANIGNSMPLSEYMLTQKFVRSPYEQTAPLRDPEWKQLEDPIATEGRVLLAVIDEKYQRDMELRMQGLDPDGKPLPAGTFPTIPNPLDDNIPDEFRTRPGQAGAFPGADGFSPAMADGGAGYVPPGSGTTGTRNRRGRGAAAMSPEAMMDGGMFGMEGMGLGTAASGLPPGQTGRGFHYVSVRAVFPIREQLYKVAEATNLSEQQARMALEILDYQVERQTMQESGDPWGGPWQPVDINVSTDVLTKMAVGLEPDIVYPQMTDPAMTMPLPTRVSGQWMKDVTHPRIEKFTLTPEQIQQEVLYQQEALRKLEELQKELPPPPAQKKGWSTLVISGAQLNNAIMGGDPMMGGGYGGGFGTGLVMGESAGAYDGGGIGGMGMGMPPRPGQAKPPAKIKPIDELLKMKDKDRAKEIEEYVKNVARAEGELMLFRYIDFSVEPGKTYRYRARLMFRNPNFNRNADEAEGDTSVVTGETRFSEWSKATTPVTVRKDQQTFVTDVRTSPGMPFPTPQLNVFQWDPMLGSLQQSVLNVKLGQTISGKARTEVLDPAKASFETKEYAFQSTDFVVDALPDIQIEAAAHPDVKPVGGTRGDLMLPEQVLVALSEGGVSILDPSVQKKSEQDWKSYHQMQNEHWKKLMEQQTSGLDGLMGADGGFGEGDGGFGFGGRGFNPLQNRNKGRRPPNPAGAMGP